MLRIHRDRALFVTQFFPPETFAGANRAHALARAISRTHQLSVIGLHPAYPDPGCYHPEATARFDATVPFTLNRRFSYTPHRHGSSVGRAVNEQFATLLLVLRALPVPADIVITSSPSMFLGPVTLAVARLKRATFVWDVRDVTWTMAIEKINGSWLLRQLASALHTVMWATARRCDMLVAATPGIAEMAKNAGVLPDRIVTVENGIAEPLKAALAAGRARTDRSRAVITYVGLLGRAQKLTTLVEVAQHLPCVDFVIVGEGPQRGEIQRLVEDVGCSNVHLMGYVPPEQLSDLLSRSDALFAQVVDSPTLNQTARPSKLIEYMAAGRPIVYAGNGDAASLIAKIGCGVCTPPGDAEAIAGAIRQLLSDRLQLDELGRRGAAYVDALPTRDERMQTLAQVLLQRFSTAGVMR